jgi:hypothetical protein
MASSPPDKATRDANLDALQSAIDTWAEDEKTRLENEVAFMRKVLEGRGISEAGTSNLAEAGSIVVDEISAFIAFDEGDEGEAS